MKANPYGTDEEFDAYMRQEYFKMALVLAGLAILGLVYWWMP